MQAPSLVIVTPALAAANNGNWQTAQRWARFLSHDYRVRLVPSWPDAGGHGDDIMIALHARRSATSVAAWKARHPERPLLLVLTGTDLYRDIASDASAQASLALADNLVVLNELGLDSLPAALRHKGRVLLQSVPARRARVKTRRHLRALMVGHLREEKSPQTYFEAVELLSGRDDIRFDHIDAALDPSLGAAAQALQRACPHYRWLGGLPHQATRARIQAAHLLVHPSRIEGGAHVVIEAVTSGTPVLASRIAGNLGLLGADYAGLFDCGDSQALAALLAQCRDDMAMLPQLMAQCARRAPLFHPDHERKMLRALLAECSPHCGDSR